MLFVPVLKLREFAHGVSWRLALFLKLGNAGTVSESSCRSGSVYYPLSETSAILFPIPLKDDYSPNFTYVLLAHALDVEAMPTDYGLGEVKLVERRVPNV